jgi:hypothetical protein
MQTQWTDHNCRRNSYLFCSKSAHNTTSVLLMLPLQGNTQAGCYISKRVIPASTVVGFFLMDEYFAWGYRVAARGPNFSQKRQSNDFYPTMIYVRVVVASYLECCFTTSRSITWWRYLRRSTVLVEKPEILLPVLSTRVRLRTV